MNCLKEYLPLINEFNIEGKPITLEPYGEGHINRTFLLTTDKKRYILQMINSEIFKDIPSLMANICHVTEYLRSIGAETLTVVHTHKGESFVKKDKYYRMYEYIENTVSYQTVTDREVFKNSGSAFGSFQNQLAAFDATVLVETIPNFHNTPKRYESFTEALKADIWGRADSCREEIEFICAHNGTYSQITEGLANGAIPLRVTHNDTKLNNILIDAESGRARAIIDLDTVMAGSMLYDFGDSIRFGASTASEDEQEIDKVHFDISLFEAYTAGFLREVRDSITEAELELMPYSAYLLTIECGMRFLTDYLSGDTYFATKYQGHNLVRARTQLKLASEMEQQLEQMSQICKKYSNK